MLRAAGEELRLELLLLAARRGGSLHARDATALMAHRLGSKTGTPHHHLRVLLEADLLVRVARGEYQSTARARRLLSATQPTLEDHGARSGDSEKMSSELTLHVAGTEELLNALLPAGSSWRAVWNRELADGSSQVVDLEARVPQQRIV